MKKHLANIGIALLVLLIIGGVIALSVGTSRANTNENTYVNVYIEDGYREKFYELRNESEFARYIALAKHYWLDLRAGTGTFIVYETGTTFTLDRFRIMGVSDNINVSNTTEFNFHEKLLYLFCGDKGGYYFICLGVGTFRTNWFGCCCTGNLLSALTVTRV